MYIHINVYYAIVLEGMYVLECHPKQKAKLVSPILPSKYAPSTYPMDPT